ncbi:TPA: hypothetical protein EYO12_03810 [Candidatus Saccharibacteria bacterium]|nr:hypothetical protein [Candidatus Saccharibacteria bacterium]HIO87835.1 hypothetical protein [Candidatus Saccharibacteria bacterium]
MNKLFSKNKRGIIWGSVALLLIVAIVFLIVSVRNSTTPLYLHSQIFAEADFKSTKDGEIKFYAAGAFYSLNANGDITKISNNLFWSKPVDMVWGDNQIAVKLSSPNYYNTNFIVGEDDTGQPLWYIVDGSGANMSPVSNLSINDSMGKPVWSDDLQAFIYTKTVVSELHGEEYAVFSRSVNAKSEQQLFTIDTPYQPVFFESDARFFTLDSAVSRKLYSYDESGFKQLDLNSEGSVQQKVERYRSDFIVLSQDVGFEELNPEKLFIFDENGTTEVISDVFPGNYVLSDGDLHILNSEKRTLRHMPADDDSLTYHLEGIPEEKILNLELIESTLNTHTLYVQGSFITFTPEVSQTILTSTSQAPLFEESTTQYQLPLYYVAYYKNGDRFEVAISSSQRTEAINAVEAYFEQRGASIYEYNVTWLPIL